MPEVLHDYTTLVAAENAIRCRSAVYPLATRNPYENLLRGRHSPANSPIWLEMASLAELVESLVIHDTIALAGIWDDDRILEKRRYAAADTIGDELAALGVVRWLPADSSAVERCEALLDSAIANKAFFTSLIETYFALLKEPNYAELPDLFSHSQTIYTFDGETVWKRIEQKLPIRAFTREFQKAALRQGNRVTPEWTDFHYPENILSFLVRGLLYDHLAVEHQIPYQPHAARAPIVLAQGLWDQQRPEDLARMTVDFVRRTHGKIAEEANRTANAALVDIAIPPIFAGILLRARSPEDIIPIAMQMRETPAAIRFRTWMRAAAQTGSTRELIGLTRDLADLESRMRKELGLVEATADIRILILGVKVAIPNWAQVAFSRPLRRHMQFLHNLSEDVLGMRSLEGALIRLFAAK